jgi:hypothetical protein
MAVWEALNTTERAAELWRIVTSGVGKIWTVEAGQLTRNCMVAKHDHSGGVSSLTGAILAWTCVAATAATQCCPSDDQGDMRLVS